MEDKEWIERDDHPLLNDVILVHVFIHVRRYDLKACRGVCKKWNEHTLPHMRSTFTVKIYGTKSEERNAETRRIVDFVKLFKSNELGIPFATYRLGAFRTTDGAGKQFLEICGNFIKEIVLYQPHDVENYVRTIENVSELLKLSPKLESLSLRGEFVSRSRNIVRLFPDSAPVLPALKKLILKLDSRKSIIKYCPTFFDELLSSAGNISDFDIDGMDRNAKLTRDITLVLNSIEKLGKESSIQSLSLENVTFGHLEILKRMAEKPKGLKLKEFSIEPNLYLNDKRNIKLQTQLATIFKDSLESFRGDSGPTGIKWMEFPRMPKLKSCKFCVRMRLGDKPVDLNQILPVIETLDLNFDFDIPGKMDSLKFFSQFDVCPTLKTLIVEHDSTCIRTFREIMRVFPNLGKLGLFLAGKDVGQVLRQISENMTQLESLSLSIYSGSRVAMTLDSLLTGIPIEGLNEIRHVIPDLEKMSAQERREKILNLVEEHKNQEPSIRDLTNLTHLKLSVSPGMKSMNILSDLTGYLGIYLMKRLRYLDIQYCELTKTCCEILTKETGVEGWQFQTQGSGPVFPSFQMSDYN